MNIDAMIEGHNRRVSESRAAINKMLEMGIDLDTAQKLRWNAARYCNMQERYCNIDPGSDRVAARWERQEALCEARIKELLRPYGIGVSFAGDPRGYVVSLHFNPPQTNSFSGRVADGWGIA